MEGRGERHREEKRESTERDIGEGDERERGIERGGERKIKERRGYTSFLMILQRFRHILPSIEIPAPCVSAEYKA